MIPRCKDLYLQGPTKFVLDNSFNILLTDFDAHCVSTYSYRGEFVHTFGKEGRQKGEFIHPKGLTISPSGQIIVFSENPDHCVQSILKIQVTFFSSRYSLDISTELLFGLIRLTTFSFTRFNSKTKLSSEIVPLAVAIILCQFTNKYTQRLLLILNIIEIR